jgi:cell division septation protein DedD
MLGRVLLQLRHDQLVLAAMAGVIGLTIIFATGVERGKQLARSERAILTRQQAAPPAPQAAPAAVVERVKRPATQVSAAAQAPMAAPTTKAATAAGQVPAQKKPEPAKTPKGKSRYAVQVVTFSRPLLAKKEMDRLRAKGERAFLIIRDGGRTVVYVGPFPSKGNAVEKVSSLKIQYRDCFVKTL